MKRILFYIYLSRSCRRVKVKPVNYVPIWEQCVDSLAQDEQWKVLMAMRTGLKERFYTFYPCIVKNFKRHVHVRLLGDEGRILSPAMPSTISIVCG